MAEQLAVGDYAAIGVYFILVFAIGIWAAFRPNRDSAAGYFLAGKNTHWFLVGASLYASNVGTPMFIGLAGTAAASGFAITLFEWHAVYLLIMLGWVFVPVYTASGAFTMPEYLKKRFGGRRLRIYLSCLAFLSYIITKISGEIFAGALFLNQVLGWNLYLCIAAILAITALCTVTGGMTAVLYTDTLQTVIVLIGACILCVLSFVEVGGWQTMMLKYRFAAANYTLAYPENYSCGLPQEDYAHMWRAPTASDVPWTGAVFGLTTLGIMNWCTDQIMVQRCLAAKNLTHAKLGTVFAAGLKIFNFFLFIIPGIISRILFPNDVACADPVKCEAVCGNRAGCTNIAYPLLVMRKMPEGIRGVMLAALLAAMMSTLTTIFNSASSMFTLDVWRFFRHHPRQWELMVVGRVTVLVLAGLSILWVPVIMQAQSGQLFSYLVATASYIAPPWCCVFLLALFWTRTTEPGAFWGLLISLVAGVVRMALDFAIPAPPCGSNEPDQRPIILKDINSLHFAIILSAISVLSTILISLFTKPRPPEKLRRVTWWTRYDPLDPEETDSDDDYGLNDDDLTEKGEPKHTKEEVTLKKKLWNWICGISQTDRPKMSKEERELIKLRMTSLAEKPTTRHIANVIAVLLATVTTFLIGFFS